LLKLRSARISAKHKGLASRPKLFFAVRDMHNILPAPKQLNTIRGSMRFACKSKQEIVAETIAVHFCFHVGHGNHIDMQGRTFIVNPQYRGRIARCILYMEHTWGYEADLSLEGGRTTAWKWHLEHPVDDAERLHNYIVYMQQHTSNFLISNATSAEAMLGEIVPML
jgi:endonuclease I